MSLPIFNLSSLDGSNGFRINSLSNFISLSASDAGDVNGDGFDDVILGDRYASPNGFRSGSSYVVFGQASGFDAQMDLTTLNGQNGFRLDGEHEQDLIGKTVSNAGDINHDGFDDVIVSGPGSSYVVFGKASDFDAEMSLSSLDGSNGFRMDGLESVKTVGSAGDVNGDGFDDVIVQDNHPGNPYNSLYVVFGKDTGFNAVVDVSNPGDSDSFHLIGDKLDSLTVASGAGDINGDGFDDLILGDEFAVTGGYYPNGYYSSGAGYVVFGRANGMDIKLDGNSGFSMGVYGAGLNNSLGASVSSAGDINGDGFDDVIVGDPNDNAYNLSAGASYVVFGKASGFSAKLDLATLDGDNGFVLIGQDEGGKLGSSVSSAGDVNGDGFDDLIVGAPHASQDLGFVEGASYVIFGKPSGFDARINLADLGPQDGFRLNGAKSDDRSGYSLSGVGDVNGDGFADLIIDSFSVNPYGLATSYVVFGAPDVTGGGELPEIKGTEGNDTLKGSEAAEHFIAGAGNDNLLGRGGADVFDAGAGDDAIRIGDLTFASIDGGEGNDALHLAGSGMNLDLSALGDQIHNIETICLYGRGDNTLTLTAGSLLNLSSSTNTIKVHGNSGDHIVVQDSGWVDGGSQGFYHAYTHDDAVLLVGANLAIDFV